MLRGFVTRFGRLGRLAPLGVLALLVVAPLFAQQHPAAGSGFNGARWDTNGRGLDLQLGDELSGDWDNYLRGASKQWSKSKVVDTKVANSAGGCQMTRGRVEVCNGRYPRENWLGLAIADLDGNRTIFQATVIMNDFYFDQPNFDRADAKRHTMCHEVGHSLGLDHRTNKGCMNDREVFGRAYDSPSKADYERLEDLYGRRGRSAATSNTDADRAATADTATPPIAITTDLIDAAVAKVKARGGTDDTVVEDLGGGKTRIIHVTFPDDAPTPSQ